ncbi:hypothetical protein FIV00_28575 [Labrenzia sp. THAF82]|nr:hypothetical protein FIV00_28575 [Labrenzia sp. THAF82]
MMKKPYGLHLMAQLDVGKWVLKNEKSLIWSGYEYRKQ